MTAFASKLSAPPLLAAVREHWRATLLLAAMLLLWLLAGASMILHGSGRGFDSPPPRLMAERQGHAPLTEAAARTAATQLKQIAPTDALAWNAAIPVSDLANPAARPFLLGGASEADRRRSLECLTAAIYYEAATEPLDGQRAVAQVVLNRVRHPAWPSTVCGVVFEGARRITGCQFTFSCDGSLRRAPMPALWERARQVAEAALGGYVFSPVGWATHYHANYVVPYWAPSLVKSATIGAHIFYRWSGGWGRPHAFASRYAGVEPAIDWRGGFGQPTMAERMAAADTGSRDAAAAAAADEAAAIGSVDSFQRAVLRRYEPLRRDTANALITERARADRNLSATQRWALTGSDTRSSEPQQRPLGRWGTVDPADAPQPIRPTPAPPQPRAAAPAPATTPTVNAPPPATTDSAAGR
ncbi:cell wall hydrolase [Sphingosinicella sp. CPCC 101087]|uniref:cell wall hydrolase n=1 Tax=Sphingosinicella sp. CPCC 101087 TaxID=2497754 RepID=UPI001FB0ECE1|nr:cell wall hydrolase [Sphingosinicella sp. CPCC 101087]